MPGSLAEDQGEVESKPTPKKTGSARTSKKGKRKMLVLFDYRGNPGKQNPSSASHSSTQRRRSATKGGESSHPPGEANSQATSQTPDQIFRLEVQNANLVEIPVSSRAGRSTGSHLQRADDFSRLTGATGQQEEETHRAVTRWEGWEYTDLPEFFNALYPYSSVLPEVREPRLDSLYGVSPVNMPLTFDLGMRI